MDTEMDEEEETFYQRDMGDDNRDRERRRRDDSHSHSSSSGHSSSHRGAGGGSYDSHSREQRRAVDDSRRRDDRDRGDRDRRSGYPSHRDSPNEDMQASWRSQGRDSREGGRERKRDRGQDYDMEGDSRDRDRDRSRAERSDRESHSHRDRPSGEGRSRGTSPAKRLRSCSPQQRDSGTSRARAMDYIPSSRSIVEDEERKPRVREFEDEMSRRGSESTSSRRPSRLEEVGRLEPRRASLDERRPSYEERRPSSSLSERKSSLDERRPMSAEGRRPSLDERRPSLDERRPSLDERRPSLDERRPSLDERRPSLDERGPSLEERRPSLEEVRPSLEERRPISAEGRKPSFGIEGRRGARRGNKFEAKDRYDNVRSRAIDMNSKVGTSGSPVELIANFFPMVTKPTWCLYNYRVDYSPEEERPAMKKRLLRVHNGVLGANIFDGSNMYTIRRLDPEPLILFSERESDRTKIQLTIKLTAQIPPGDVQYLQFYNIIIRACMNALKFEELGRHFYDRHSSIKIPQHHLELWPGYITTLRNYEENLMLCVEVTHKVLRQETCLSILYTQQRERDSRERAGEVLIGSIVMTHYNRKTYRVDDVDWTKNPRSTFDMKGKTITLADYYQAKYDLNIRDLNQPLLVSRPKKKELHRGEAAPILLIPELCQMTGLSEDIRKNYQTMRELSTHLQQAPDRRVENIQNFMRRLRCCTDVRELIAKWGLEFEGRLVPIRGRIVPTEQVIFRTGVEPDAVKVGANADWTFAFKSKNMYSSMRMTRWALIVTNRDSRGVENLLHTMRTVGKTLDFEIGPPQSLLKLPDNKVQTFVNAINQVMADHKHMDIIFVILPNQLLELYSAIKKRCCLDFGVASQCFLSKHLQPNAKGLMSIMTKVVVQINAKLGGEPWATHNPLKASHTMIIGFDIYHCGKRKGASVGAMVCTTNRDLSRYYSTVSFHSGREELSEKLCADIAKCIYAFRSKNKDELPDRIIMYRDGVGEGQLSYIYNTELTQIKTALGGMYSAVGRSPPKFTLIICTKKGNARIFNKSGAGVRNPDAGTVVDNTITLPERYDFFLISQASRQGTVSPTTYNVIFDEQGLDPDKIQRLTFKLCHLYYNWSGTVAVPAVCQYSHKLAYLTGLSLGNPAHERMAHYLYFL